METRRIYIDKENIDSALIKDAGEIIRAGGLVAFPTETVYGLGADAENPEASARIYRAKGRPSDNPLIVHIADLGSLEEIASEVPDDVYRLAEAFWPGPMTLIVKKNKVIPYETTGGLDTVAVRMPVHPIALELIKSSGRMIAAPSANASGRPSPTDADHVWEDLSGRIDMLIDGGPVELGLESTIIDLSEEHPTILRPGFITPEMIAEVTGDVRMDKGLRAGSDVRPKAPGMKYRHYAPRGRLVIVEGDPVKVTERINELVSDAIDRGGRTAVICTEETASGYDSSVTHIIGRKSDEETIAHNLFSILRQMDDEGVEFIYSEGFDGTGIGDAIMNRLLKAAGHQVIEV